MDHKKKIKINKMGKNFKNKTQHKMYKTYSNHNFKTIHYK